MDELLISGKRFISAKRIAREHGYTADYIGQLIRGGKITGQKVGRAWYVDESSFSAYLEGEAYVPTTPKEVISSEAVLLEVLPEQEVVAVAEVVVEEIPEDAPVQEVEVHHPIRMVVGIREDDTKETVTVEEATTVSVESTYVPLQLNTLTQSKGLTYYADDTPSLPEIRRNNKESLVLDGEVELHSVPVDKVKMVQRHQARMRARHFVGLAVLGVAIFVFSAGVSSVVSQKLLLNKDNVAAVSYYIDW
jgi:hypothetical protein